MSNTFSEDLFEAFCQECQIKWERVPASSQRTPDYELVFTGIRVIVEVKEILRNEQELESDRLLEERGVGLVTGGTPGGRVRLKIADSSGQIKARAKGKHPSMLVLFDSGRGHLDPYQIRVAMFGLEQLRLSVPPIGQGSPTGTGWRYGPKKKMTEDHNTSISAIAALIAVGPTRTILQVFHNPFASVPLSPDLLRIPDIEQFSIGPSDSVATGQWHSI
ncbi:MAG TPA: hypothetical protein VNJ02_09340 [Vicinamibacterales bacterium]|nr:hypothetical protein [Vicinamibacterales bacterium]